VRWETEWSFDGKLCREYLYQKLSKSGNWFSSDNQKCQGCFLGHSGGLDFGLIYELGLTLVLTFVCGRKSVLRNRRITAIIQLDKLTL